MKAQSTDVNRTQTTPSATTQTPSPFRPPLKPRRGLFYLGLALVTGWCVVLVVMFFTTVYPHPERDPHRRPAAATVSR